MKDKINQIQLKKGNKMIKRTCLALSTLLLVGCGQPNEKYTIVQENIKEGVINNSGYVVVKPTYKHIFNFSGVNNAYNHPHLLNLHWFSNTDSKKYAIVQDINNKFGIINEKGELLLKPVYNSITYFFNGFARIQVGNKYGLIDENFNVVLKPTFDYIQEFVDGTAIVEQNNKYGCITKNIELKINTHYDKIYFQKGNFMRTYSNNKWGYLHNNCDTLVRPIYDYAYDFSNGMAKVVVNGKVGYINNKAKLIARPMFTTSSSSF